MELAERNHLVALLIGLLTISLLAPPAMAEEKLSLRECIDIALDRNVGVIARENQLESAKWNLWEAWGDALPSVSTSAGYTFSKTFGQKLIQLPDTIYIGTDPGSRRYSTDIGMSVTLFDGGATWFGIRQANQRRSSSYYDLRGVMADVAYQVKLAYYRLVTSQMLLRVQRDALARSKKQLEVTQSRYELGSAALSEKLKAEVTVASDSLALIQRVNDIRTAEFDLNIILNRDVTLPIVPADTLVPTTFGQSLEQCLAISLESNPVLRKSKTDYDAAQTGVWLAKQNWWPRVSASLGWSWSPVDGDDWFKYRYDDGSYFFRVSISYTLFDAFRKKTLSSKAKLGALTSREAYDAARNELVSAVRRAHLDYERSRLQLQVAELLERSAEEDMKLQQERYRLGASSILELLDAQVSLTNAQYLRVQALYDLNRAVADLARAMGQM